MNSLTHIIKVQAFSLILLGSIAILVALFSLELFQPRLKLSHYTDTPPTNLYAEIVSTNLVSVPCPCGYCKPDQGIAVPEHINQIGFDLKVVVSTSYYPVVIRPSNSR